MKAIFSFDETSMNAYIDVDKIVSSGIPNMIADVINREITTGASMQEHIADLVLDDLDDMFGFCDAVKGLFCLIFNKYDDHLTFSPCINICMMQHQCLP